MKILIADDHKMMRQELIGLLREEFRHSEIHEVSNGLEAIKKMNGTHWDLILLDISMPLKNGIETLKQLRLNGISTPILMISIHGEDQYISSSLKAGASGFMNKACADDELIKAVHTVLSGRKYIP